MLSQFKISKNDIPILAVVILAAALRFYNFWDIPFMHDEFSAILRTYYDSFSELIEIGVKQNDSHPAGVQVFIFYWIKIFGLSEASLKFPFLIMGTASVYLTYALGKKWFGSTPAILSAVLIAVMQFPIFHSQLARPYSPGLFLVLLSSYYWTEMVFGEHRKKTVVLYILVSALAAYVHAFSLFFIFIQGLSGLLFLKKGKLRRYILFNLLVFLLYLPHIGVFIAQLGRGDIGGWLGKPDAYFIFSFFDYAFHFSKVFLFLFFVIVIVFPIIKYNRKKGLNKFRLLSISWFMISFLTAYLYSVFRSPIIQYSTLLFVFPYLLLFLFSFTSGMKFPLKMAIVTIIALVGFYTLLTNREHYKIMYTQGFDGIVEEYIDDIEYHKVKNYNLILHAPEHRMFDYYLKKNNVKNDYLKLFNESSIEEIESFLSRNPTDILFYGWADYSTLEHLQYFKRRFKYCIHSRSFFNSEYYMFSNFPIGDKFVENKKNSIELIKTENGILYESDEAGYSKAIEVMLDTLNLGRYDIINLSAEINSYEMNTDALLVFEIKDSDGDVLSWSASDLKKFYSLEKKGRNAIFHSKRVLSIYPFSESSVLKSYIWKRDTTNLSLRSLDLFISHIEPIQVGLYDDIHGGNLLK